MVALSLIGTFVSKCAVGHCKCAVGHSKYGAGYTKCTAGRRLEARTHGKPRETRVRAMCSGAVCLCDAFGAEHGMPADVGIPYGIRGVRWCKLRAFGGLLFVGAASPNEAWEAVSQGEKGVWRKGRRGALGSKRRRARAGAPPEHVLGPVVFGVFVARACPGASGRFRIGAGGS